jgi:hypothetical protein
MGHQPLGDQGLGMRIDRRRRVDQDQNLRVEAQRSCQYHALSLAAGQPATTLVDPSLPASLQAGKHVLGRGHAQRRLSLGKAQTSMRIKHRLQRTGKYLTGGIADHDPLPNLINRHICEVY